ncbi:ATP-binding protein [Streptomyces sp. BR123]|uniref:ATP-binding protein n=1 Tax=Streptomyces sp. BR123 TaxID=2749828 RepID=UPI0015C49362|nr:ATP-binding protein [Streptomyces sp. BR123]NXY93340.1 ATP-binding protein [Streptomyces sp. BR123]
MSEEIRRLALGSGARGVVARCRDFTLDALTAWQWIARPPGDGRQAADRQYGPGGQHGKEAADEDPDRAEAAEDVLLMVSELVSNACVHAGGPSELVLRRTPDRLRLEVGDGSPEHPRRRTATDPALPGGHGLLVVERLARDWGWEPRPDGTGKTVWAEVPSPLPRQLH